MSDRWASGKIERDAIDIDPCRLTFTARVVLCPKRNTGCEYVETDCTSKRRAQRRPRIYVFQGIQEPRRSFVVFYNHCAVSHYLLSKGRVPYRIASSVGGAFHFKNAEVDVRNGRVAHRYCYVIVPVVKTMQLEMRSLCVDPAGTIATHGCIGAIHECSFP